MDIIEREEDIFSFSREDLFHYIDHVCAIPTDNALVVNVVINERLYHYHYHKGATHIDNSMKIIVTSSSVKKGDTTIIIQSKTIESYDASKKL